MKAAVREIWLPFNVALEGRVPWMYLDARGRVSTAVGVPLDETVRELGVPTARHRANSLAASRRLPWRHGVRGPFASDPDIDAAWETVKQHRDLARRGRRRFQRLTDLRLTEGAIDRMVFDRLDRTETLVRGRMVRAESGAVALPFDDFETWPADAQLALLSMCWVAGPAFDLPRFHAAAARRDWLACAVECRVEPDMGAVARRNERNRQLFRYAYLVERDALDPERLAYDPR
ncbi:hypothetical protein [Nocardia bovistercoris]|uniref:Uncharacterized protein n=1 Tax=Nocardia bovistercoris TaxID=2785916 RepID=A0A931IGN8_9NOCA|nr:hypothetical protein [Nocardia bovistercoris]MBH0779687.1 hypothetical protein [Nocardia bovistercoris]